MTTLRYMGKDVVQITGQEWCEPDDYTNSYWDLGSRRTYEPPALREKPIKKLKNKKLNTPKSNCYKKYKEFERKAVEAANNGKMLEAYHYFTSAANGRKEYWKRFYGNRPDSGHYAKWLCNIGSAWIQREGYENGKLEEQVTNEYDRENSKPRKYNPFWARREMDIRAKNGNYFKHSMKQRQNIRNKY